VIRIRISPPKAGQAGGEAKQRGGLFSRAGRGKVVAQPGRTYSQALTAMREVGTKRIDGEERKGQLAGLICNAFTGQD
jgi:hypothetical protein